MTRPIETREGHILTVAEVEEKKTITQAVLNPETENSTLAIPENKGIESIGDAAFYECTRLTEITLPDGLQSIGSAAFRGCTSLTAITLPEGLQSIGARAFYGCTRLANITLSDGLQSISEGAFANCTSFGWDYLT